MQADRGPDGGTGRPLALVTGASSGIGLELGRVFVDNGYDVLVSAEDDELYAAESSLAGNGAEVRAVQADLSTPRWGGTALVGGGRRRPAP